MTKAMWTVAIATMFLFCGPGFAATEVEIHVGSIQQAKDTAGIKPTVAMVMQKVAAGVELINRECRAAFHKFKGLSSEFIYASNLYLDPFANHR